MNKHLELSKTSVYLVALFTMNLLVAKFVLANKDEGVSHVVDVDERVSLCGFAQKIGSSMKSMGKVDSSIIQCIKCKKAYESFYSAHTGS